MSAATAASGMVDMAFKPAVIVIGAGPCGLTLCNLLGSMQVPTLLIERNSSTVNEPRAVSIDDESLRTMQAIGLDAEVLSDKSFERALPIGHALEPVHLLAVAQEDERR